VSIVAERWRRCRAAALWKRYPPQITTGAVSTRQNHCQYRNCQSGFIATAITGSVSARQTRARWRSSESSGSGASSAFAVVGDDVGRDVLSGAVRGAGTPSPAGTSG
jgi:hypothetical protein